VKTLSVYVAGSSAEIDRARAATERLRAAGLVVVSTWPDVVAAVGDANPPDASRKDRAEWARTDLDEVTVADIVLLLCPHESAGRGAYLEAGYALRQGKPVYAAGRTEQSVFCALMSEHVLDEDAIDAIVEWNARTAEAMDLRVKEALNRG